jgi:O-antigen ligase
LYTSKTSTAIAAAVIGLMFVLWFSMGKKLWTGILVGLAVLATVYVVKVDVPMGMMDTRPRMWKTVMRDAVIRPITGWGLDSFRQFTAAKKTKYIDHYQQTGNVLYMCEWDNAHNLLIQLFFEFGIVSWILLGGWLRDVGMRFRRSVKSRNAVGLAGFVIVFFVVSMAHFPIYLACMATIIVPMIALFEKELDLYGHTTT